MNKFDFIAGLHPYSESPQSIRRLNQRHRLLVEPYLEEFSGARVLDLGAHDGRWSYALAQAGAREVVGIEARQALIDNFAKLPNAPWTSRVRLLQGDMFDVLERMVAAGERFDIVAAYGVFYHIMDHLRLLTLLHRLRAPVIFIDGEFSLKKGAVIDLLRERTAHKVNAAPQRPGQERAVIGIPSVRATEIMAQSLGYDVIWPDAGDAFGDDPTSVEDYFRTEGKRRRFCILVKPGA